LHTKCEYKGNFLSVVLLVLNNGSCPVGDFLASLTPQERRKVDVLFELIGCRGRISNKEHFKKIEGTDLFEFKRHQVRLLCFYTEDKQIVICHALRKKKDRHKKRDLDLATDLRNLYLKQCAGGNDHER